MFFFSSRISYSVPLYPAEVLLSLLGKPTDRYFQRKSELPALSL